VKDDDNKDQKENVGSNSSTVNVRRESITRNKYDADHHDKFLKPRLDKAANNDFAILSDDEDEEASSDFYDGEDDEEGLFKFEDEELIPPLKLNSRLISPPVGSSVSSSRRQSRGGITKPTLKTKRSNSQTPTSPELLYYHPSNKTRVNRRHSSIRSTLDGPRDGDVEIGDDTDEEDWASMGANQLLKPGNHSSISIGVGSSGKTSEILQMEQQGGLKQDEQDAAFALVNLRSV
jgi:hypothetical protein